MSLTTSCISNFPSAARPWPVSSPRVCCSIPCSVPHLCLVCPSQPWALTARATFLNALNCSNSFWWSWSGEASRRMEPLRLPPPCTALAWPAFLSVVMEIVGASSAAFPSPVPPPGTDPQVMRGLTRKNCTLTCALCNLGGGGVVGGLLFCVPEHASMA